MKRNVAVIVALVVGSAGCEYLGFPAPRPGLDSSPPPPCAVEREQALSRISPGCLGFFLDADTGGPLHCVPGAGDACDDIEAGCVSDPIVVDATVQTTLAVEFTDECNGFPINIQGIALLPEQPGVVILEPRPSGTGFLFLGVGPFTAPGRLEQLIEVRADARNLIENGFSVGATLTLVIEATDP